MPGMIVAPQPIAVEEGAKVLLEGGNAVDAAVTTAFVQCIVDPHSCGVGGYTLLNLHLAESAGSSSQNTITSLILDAPAVAGSKVQPDMWQTFVVRPNPDGWGYFLKGRINDLGYRSTCVPGAIKGFSAMLERWGTISWHRAIEPAIRIADEGFVVSAHLAGRWKDKAIHPEAASAYDALRSNPEASRIYLRLDGSPYDAGDRLRNSDYARTLRRLTSAGAADFYEGEIADQMISDLATNSAYWTCTLAMYIESINL